MEADNLFLCILEAMDRLWFHQIILFQEPSSPLVTKTLPQSHSFTSGVSSSFNINEGLPSSVLASTSSISEEDISSFPSMATPQSSMGHSNNEVGDGEEHKGVKKKERPERLINLVTDKTRSHSSSSSTKKARNSLGHSRKLHKSMSCRSSSELELEEVKGFMDIGFKFEKENLSPRMLSVVPGLQRLGLLREKHSSTISELNAIAESVAKDEKSEEEEDRGVLRPYLSEAWLIKRPNSQLLNLKMPTVYAAAAEMKKHLRFWARMVASEIQ